MAATDEPGGWLIRVETFPRFTDSAQVLREFSMAITSDQTLHSATPSLDPSAGVLRADMTIEEPRQGRAMEIGIRAFYRGLDAAGYRTEMPGWRLLVEAVMPLPK